MLGHYKQHEGQSQDLDKAFTYRSNIISFLRRACPKMHKDSGKNCQGYLQKRVKYQVCRDKYLNIISDAKLLEHFKCLSLKISFF